MDTTTNELSSSLEIIAVDMRHLAVDQKEVHQMILENLKTALKTYVNSIAILSEEKTCYNLLAIMLVHHKLQVLLQPKRFDIHAVHSALESIKVEQGEVSVNIEIDLLRHVSKLIEKAGQKMKVSGKLIWLSTKCPTHTKDVMAALEKLKQQQVSIDFININSLEICPDERQFSEVSIPLANWAVALREYPNCRLHRLGTDETSFERYFKERIEEQCVQGETVFVLRGFSARPMRLKARPRVVSALDIEQTTVCACHQLPLAGKSEPSGHEKKSCFVLKSALDDEDISKGVKLGKIVLPFVDAAASQALKHRDSNEVALDIKLICPLSSLSEDLLEGKSFVVHATEGPEDFEALVNILSDEENFLLTSTRFSFEQRKEGLTQCHLALIPDRASSTLLMKALVSHEQLSPQSLVPVSDTLDPQLLERVRNDMKQIPRGELNVMELRSNLHEIINTAVKTAPPPRTNNSHINITPLVPLSNAKAPTAATVPPVASVKRISTVPASVAKQRPVHAIPSPPKASPKKKSPSAGVKKAQRFENVMMNLDD